MSEAFFALSPTDRLDALAVASQRSGRPTHLLEKDVWVVWTLRALFQAQELRHDLTFKGGTSLSKAYRLIDRFSEDIDLTYDIRRLIPDLVPEGGFLPANRSQEKRWSSQIKNWLPGWIREHVKPVLQAAIEQEELEAKLEVVGDNEDILTLSYPPQAEGTGYMRPTVVLEFGARATGEPHQPKEVRCDMAEFIEGVDFPMAVPLVMSVGRTFWEKATAAHVYCAQRKAPSARFARHWYDLAAIARSEHSAGCIQDRAVAQQVADHKGWFFSAKDHEGKVISYQDAIRGRIQIVPQAEARERLAEDYRAMEEDSVMIGDAQPFDELMAQCEQLQEAINEAAR